MPIGAAVAILFFLLVGIIQVRRTIPLWKGSPDSYYLRMYTSPGPIPAFWPWPLTERLWRMFPKYEVVIPIACFDTCLLLLVLALDLRQMLATILSLALLTLVCCCVFVLPWTISYLGTPRLLIPPPLRDQ